MDIFQNGVDVVLVLKLFRGQGSLPDIIALRNLVFEGVKSANRRDGAA